MKKAYILMSRVPIAKKTKTRLMDVLTGEECAEIHKMFLKDLFTMTEELLGEVDIFLTYTPEDEYKIMEDLVAKHIEVFPQRGSDLGYRMGNAIKYVLDQGYDSVILTGTDIPSIQSRDILDGFRILDKKDIVLSPTMDGGYYLIGMKEYKAYLFEEKYDWGNKSIFERTKKNIELHRDTFGVGRENLDIDTKEDLILFLEKMSSVDKSFRKPENTLKYIENFFVNIY